MYIKKLIIVAVVLLFVAVGTWAVAHHFGLSYNPKINGPKVVAEKAEADAEKAYENDATKAWNDYYHGKISLDDLTKKLADLESDRKKRKKVATDALNKAAGTDNQQLPPKNTLQPAREPIRQFTALDPVKHAYQLDSREEWRELDVTGAANSHINIKTDQTFRVCSADADPCVDGNGLHLPAAGNDKYHPTWYPFGRGAYYALIGRWGPDGEPFSIGTEYSGIIPANADGKKLQVMANVQATPQTLAPNTGGHRITEITIQ
jgi:hypothetical protein